MTNLKESKIYISGGNGFLGSHLVDQLRDIVVSDQNLYLPPSTEIDLRNPIDALSAVDGKDVVIHLAGNVGGIGYNREHPGTLFYDNLMMGVNLIEAARQIGTVKKLILVGTVCSYPKLTPTPFLEEDFWNGFPEETNAPYGIAKKALLTMAQAYQSEFGLNSIYLLPVNLYGPRDHFDPKVSHVIPALISRFINAKNESLSSVTSWGTGNATREFLYVEDAARGIILAAKHLDELTPINLGSGDEISIRCLTELIAKLTGFTGKIEWDASKPDGQPRRKLDIRKAFQMFGFKSEVGFEEGLERTIEWFRRSTKP